MQQLAAGDPAPDFALPDQRGSLVRLSGFRGRKVLLYFYPEADTPGCTDQSRAVRDAREDFAEIGVAVLGVSPDPPEAQKRFDEKHGLGFPLLSDADHRVAEAYGVWGEREMHGQRVVGILRSSFLLDEEGRVAHAWYGVSPRDTVPKAVEALVG